MNIIKPGFQMRLSQIRVQRIQQWWMVGQYKIQQTTHHRLLAGYVCVTPCHTLSNPLPEEQNWVCCNFFNRCKRACLEQIQHLSNFQKKTAVLKSKTPTITELVKEPSPWKQSEMPPELVEFEDGASDVPFTIVPFFPTLQSQNRENSVDYTWP